MGHGAQHEPHSPLRGRSRSQVAPRPPVHHLEGRCARQGPKRDSCAAGRPRPFRPLPPPGRSWTPRSWTAGAPGRSHRNIKHAGGAQRGGPPRTPETSRSGRCCGAGGSVPRTGCWGGSVWGPFHPASPPAPAQCSGVRQASWDLTWKEDPLLSLSGHKPSTSKDIHGQSHQARLGGAVVVWSWRGSPPVVPSPRELPVPGSLFWEPLV